MSNNKGLDHKDYYVYCHNSNIDGKCFYIGVGRKDRVFSQCEHRNKNWKRKVWLEGGFSFRILVSGLPKKKALEIERSFIKQIGLENLTNIVGEFGNSTAFKKGLIPWNKGLTGAQACVYKPLVYEGIKFESVKQLREYLKISNTHFYRKVNQGKIIFKFIEKD